MRSAAVSRRPWRQTARKTLYPELVVAGHLSPRRDLVTSSVSLAEFRRSVEVKSAVKAVLYPSSCRSQRPTSRAKQTYLAAAKAIVPCGHKLQTTNYTMDWQEWRWWLGGWSLVGWWRASAPASPASQRGPRRGGRLATRVRIRNPTRRCHPRPVRTLD